MDKTKRAKLKKAGWMVSDAPDFLALSKEQLELIDLKISLGEAVRAKREAHGFTQAELAKKLHTSQSRLANIEQGSASLDLLLRALLVLGARSTAGRIISGSGQAHLASL